jgi:seryl-tRNA synthetase
MSCERIYDVHELDPAVLEEIRDAIRAGARTITHRIEPSSGRLVVESEDENALFYVDSLVAEEKRLRSKRKTKVLFSNVALTPVYQGDIDDDLSKNRDLCVIGSGLSGLRGPLLGVFKFFEHEFLCLAQQFHAQEHHYPVMLPLEVLHELGYFRHFPQQVTLCSHFMSDLLTLEKVGSKLDTMDTFVNGASKLLEPPSHALQPAVCLPCYRQFRNARIQTDESLALTIQNHVFRYEGANLRSLSRLWDFTVRDIVFLGDAERLSSLRMATMEWSIALCRELDLDGSIELANDPFFLNESRDKKLYQRMGEVKYELCLKLPKSGGKLAVSSYNLHRDFYSTIYDIRLANGEHAETGCVGFGIERWLYGFLSQKSLEPENWPDRVKRFVFASTT